MIINDTYRTDVCLLYPPHVIAIAAIYLSLVNNERINAPSQPHSTSTEMQMTPENTVPTPASNAGPTPAGATSPSQGTHTGAARSSDPDPVTFLASLNVSLATIATIAQEMISFYTLSSRYVDESGPPASGASSSSVRNKGNEGGSDAFLMDLDGKTPSGIGAGGSVEKMRPKQMVELVKKMRGEKEREFEGSVNSAQMMSPATASSAHTIKGRAVNKRLERAQAAG
jgi:cyclin C